MITQELNNAYEAAKKTDNFGTHSEFIKLLLASNDTDLMELQYEIMQNPENRDLQRVVGHAFAKRGKDALPFLLNKLRTDTSEAHKANTIHTLGLLKQTEILPEILSYVRSSNEEIRYKAIIVSGWIGNDSTIAILAELLRVENVGILRGFIGSAMRQICSRMSEVKDYTVNLLINALKTETDEEGAAIMIVVVQSLLKQKFGLKEDGETGLIWGDVEKAKAKLLKAFPHNRA